MRSPDWRTRGMFNGDRQCSARQACRQSGTDNRRGCATCSARKRRSTIRPEQTCAGPVTCCYPHPCLQHWAHWLSRRCAASASARPGTCCRREPKTAPVEIENPAPTAKAAQIRTAAHRPASGRNHPLIRKANRSPYPTAGASWISSGSSSLGNDPITHVEGATSRLSPLPNGGRTGSRRSPGSRILIESRRLPTPVGFNRPIALAGSMCSGAAQNVFVETAILSIGVQRATPARRLTTSSACARLQPCARIQEVRGLRINPG